MDSRWTEVNIVCSDPKWKTQKIYLDTNKKVFDAELYTIGEALEIVLRSGQGRYQAVRHRSEPMLKKVHIWADSQTAMRRLQHTALGPAQWLARCIMERAR